MSNKFKKAWLEVGALGTVKSFFFFLQNISMQVVSLVPRAKDQSKRKGMCHIQVSKPSHLSLPP